MVQGDAYDLAFSIDADDEPLDISAIESVYQEKFGGTPCMQ